MNYSTLDTLWNNATIKSIIAQSSTGLVVLFNKKLDNNWFSGIILKVNGNNQYTTQTVELVVKGDVADWAAL